MIPLLLLFCICTSMLNSPLAREVQSFFLNFLRRAINHTIIQEHRVHDQVATSFNDAVGTAVRFSNLIENKGQCTALRHFVCPDMSAEKIDSMYKAAPNMQSGCDAVEHGEFAGIFPNELQACAAQLHGGGGAGGNNYQALPSAPLVKARLSKELPVGIEEKWRQL